MPNTARSPLAITPVESPEEMAASPATRAVHDFAGSAAMQVLRDWANSPEIQAIRAASTAAPQSEDGDS